MTATITPPTGAIDLHRVDPKVRLDDYMNALTYYLGPKAQSVDRIVFVENSGSDLSALKQLCIDTKKRVEFISFFGLDYPAHFNRGYGEYKLLDYAFSESQLLAELDDSDMWWKVTGRLKVTNIDRMIHTAPNVYDMYVDFRPKRAWADVRLISYSKQGYRELMLGLYPEFAESRIEEFFFCRFAKKVADKNGMPSDRVIVREFLAVPRFEGHGGWMNTDYSSRKFRLIYAFRDFALLMKRLFRRQNV